MTKKIYRRRRNFAISVIGLILAGALAWQANFGEKTPDTNNNQELRTATQTANSDQPTALESLKKLEIKGRAPKTGYSRDEFGNGWANWRNCDTRQKILARDLTNLKFDENNCIVLSGTLNDPYTGKTINFKRENASAVQIDHVVALSDAWQKGAQNLTRDQREELANDDLELIASDGGANMQKSDGDAATWLPPNKNFRCQYVARQIAVKIKYSLWVTEAEHEAMARILGDCPDERLPAP